MRGRFSDVERRRCCGDDVKLAISSAVGAGDVAVVAEGHSSCATPLVDVPGSPNLAPLGYAEWSRVLMDYRNGTDRVAGTHNRVSVAAISPPALPHRYRG